MKLVYDCEQSISLGPKREFESTSIWWHLHLLDAEQALNLTNRTYYKTFEEFFEVLTLKQLGQHSKSISLLNTRDYYDDFNSMMAVTAKRGFMSMALMQMSSWDQEPRICFSILMRFTKF